MASSRILPNRSTTLARWRFMYLEQLSLFDARMQTLINWTSASSSALATQACRASRSSARMRLACSSRN